MHGGVMQRWLSVAVSPATAEMWAQGESSLPCCVLFFTQPYCYSLPSPCILSRGAFVHWCFAVGGCSAHSEFWNMIGYPSHCYLSVSMGCSIQTLCSHQQLFSSKAFPVFGGVKIAKGLWEKAVAVLTSQLLSFLQSGLVSQLLDYPFYCLTWTYCVWTYLRLRETAGHLPTYW